MPNFNVQLLSPNSELRRFLRLLHQLSDGCSRTPRQVKKLDVGWCGYTWSAEKSI